MSNITSRRPLALGLSVAAVAAIMVTGGAAAADAEHRDDRGGSAVRTPVSVKILSPRSGDNAGSAGRGWIVNLAVRYPGGDTSGLHAAGFDGPQLTGPGAHNNVAPFPGTFSPGKDDRLPGLVVLASTTSNAPGLSGPGTNLADLFNTTGIGDRTASSTEILDNWIVGAPVFGVNTGSVLTVAVVKDLDHNGIFDDAPDVVPDANDDARIDAEDLRALGLASEVETVRFRLNGAA
jgi:hypothetical protein